MKLPLLVLIMIAVFTLGAFFGANLIADNANRVYAQARKIQGGYDSPVSDSITVQEAIFHLKVARASHQYYVDNPSATNQITGSPEDNYQWVLKYDSIIKILQGIFD